MSKFTILHTFYNPVEAEIFKARLESEGIRAYVLDQNQLYSQIPSTMGGYRLQVETEYFLKAKQILDKSLENEE
ncbi:DUF2007 domain-containing protein [Weeksellaceae bacterium KMM 9713]|uniref:DUF2007 domain-containing protein n=1 Tax=Profundicola chukchiensis TaxID=2961959 RepID=A0A9X4MZ82_9FLAO|nr:DUF2007 domain-containing protein [Profundicola chukchiensis]MDG4946759.1 DUF2007 domain-containing protein [Profundicola chukchiensis]MDG4949757.1 DUF2007 domain-containing protein [Profundicola chukchiensis]